MKILLLGDYSNVHWTLAEGLREIGHSVTVVSDGDSWKGYQRDISLKRTDTSHLSALKYVFRVVSEFRKFRGYDVVQLINPVFLQLKAERIYPFYRFLRRHNDSVFLGAFGMDHYWVKAGMDCRTFRYSDFNIGKQLRIDENENVTFINDWLYGQKGVLNKEIAQDCDGIISGLQEYECSYRPYFSEKLRYIPFPINTSLIVPQIKDAEKRRVRIFIGIQRARSHYKGTDIMLQAAEKVVAEYPDLCELIRVESVPYNEYQVLMDSSDILLDQLYSYTPAMNALLAMAKGLVVVGGGEPENYELLNETSLRPIINVVPTEDSVYCALKDLVLHREKIPILSKQSIEYIHKHHDYCKVAQQYITFWTGQISKKV